MFVYFRWCTVRCGVVLWCARCCRIAGEAEGLWGLLQRPLRGGDLLAVRQESSHCTIDRLGWREWLFVFVQLSKVTTCRVLSRAWTCSCTASAHWVERSIIVSRTHFCPVAATSNGPTRSTWMNVNWWEGTSIGLTGVVVAPPSFPHWQVWQFWH